MHWQSGSANSGCPQQVASGERAAMSDLVKSIQNLAPK